MKNSNLISYILIGILFVAIIIPLIALLVKSLKEQKELDEVKPVKKSNPRQLIQQESPYAYID
jgi:hypothetical protein